MKTRTLILMMLFAVVCGLTVRLIRQNAEQPEPTIQRDTVVIRDTIRPPVPAPEVITVVRHDTVRPQAKPPEGETPDVATSAIPGDTTPGNEAIIPITQNAYVTEDYAAIIEGYKPRLVSIELYPKTTTVTITKTRSQRWALTGGVGVGYDGRGVRPYVGVTFGVVLWSK